MRQIVGQILRNGGSSISYMRGKVEAGWLKDTQYKAHKGKSSRSSGNVLSSIASLKHCYLLVASSHMKSTDNETLFKYAGD